VNQQDKKDPAVKVEDLMAREALGLEVLAASSHLGRRLLETRVQRGGRGGAPGTDCLQEGKILVLGEEGMILLGGMQPEQIASAVRDMCRCGVPCVLLAGGVEPPEALVRAAEETGITLLGTGLDADAAVDGIESFLEERLAPSTSLHGVLMELYDVGTLILGESGIGKSECALDLVDRGHRLVADDLVEIRRSGDRLVGSPPEMLRGMMEVRGLGVMNVRQLFGLTAVLPSIHVDQVVELEGWAREKEERDRLGLEQETHEILGVTLPLLRIPVTAGRHLSILVELAARTYMLRREGIRPAEEIQERLRREIVRTGGKE
jgi:HPr kinase/phosphorylase